MNNKIALLTGISGQDGSYLTELLIGKGYTVHGIIRRSSSINTKRIDHLINKYEYDTLFLHYGDLTDANSIYNILLKTKPDEVYNIGSQSHVRVSFDVPEYTAQVTGVGPLKLLEAIKNLNLNCKYLQASSSEMFGVSPPPQNEKTPFQPQSPYGISKLFAYWMTKAYRTGYNMFACNSICFNHESPRRGDTFVTKKIVRAAVRIKLGVQNHIRLGNLDAARDWGHAKDYTEAMHLIMNHSEPDDFVIATEHFYSVREFLEVVFNKLNLEIGDHLILDNGYKRPNEVPALRGDASKIRDVLSWKPRISFNELVDEMINEVMKEEKNEIKCNTQ